MYYIVYEPKTYYYITRNADIITVPSGYYVTTFPAPDDNVVDIISPLDDIDEIIKKYKL